MTKKQRERASELIAAALGEANEETVKRLLCAALGHPPVVRYCFGELTCARCGDVVGDTLMKGSSLEQRAMTGHDCPTCRRVWQSLTPDQRLLTTNPFAKKAGAA